MSSRRMAIVLALGSAVVLVAMVAVGLATGVTQEAHEHVDTPAHYTASLLANPGALRVIFGLDVAFIIVYTGFFAAFADYLRRRERPFVWLALGAMLVTVALDVVEDHHILAQLAIAEQGQPIDGDAIVFQHVVSASKFTASYLSLFVYGLALPRTTKLDRALVAFLTIGTLVTAVLGYAAPAGMREQLDSGRWIGFLIGFSLVIAWLRSAPEPQAPAA
jgi:hypothetical protein